jgi:3-deoxy-D-manno-octulosonic-acid transferase
MEPAIPSHTFPQGTYITLSCTHAGEEELLLDALYPGPWTLFIAPRHPERFELVADLLARKNIPFARLGAIAPVILIDQMGVLPSCYTVSKAAIVGGSFVPGIGGHNILEPILYHCPVLFGPYMFAQQEMVHQVLLSQGGLQTEAEHLRMHLESILKNPPNLHPTLQGLRGVAQATLNKIRN